MFSTASFLVLVGAVGGIPELLPPEDLVTPEMARQQLAPLLERATLD